MSAETDVRLYLSTAGVSGLATTNCFVGPVRKATGSLPISAVFVREMSGTEPSPSMDRTRKTYREWGVQVTLRGAVNQYLDTKARADAVWSKLDRVTNASLSSGSVTYVRAVCAQAGPLYVGQNDQEQDLFVVNAVLAGHTTI